MWGLYLAAIPVASIPVAYVYELGFTRTLGIPSSLISLDWVSICRGGLAVAGFTMIALLSVALLNLIEWAEWWLVKLAFRSRRMQPSRLELTLLALPSGLLSSALAMAMFYFGAWLLATILGAAGFEAVRKSSAMAIPLTVGILVYGVASLSFWTRRTRNAPFVSKTASIPRLAGGYLPRHLLLLSACVALLLAAVGWVGHASAMVQSDYLVLESTPELVVLRDYQDHLVCARFDRETKTVQRDFVVLTTASEAGRSLKVERIGPLTLSKGDEASGPSELTNSSGGS
ncbi:MAG: hypothetical protein NTU41_01435 [Chloroflexi bacterium]|nr:hypothetical protein [Chloroflexota bacterium]